MFECECATSRRCRCSLTVCVTCDVVFVDLIPLRCCQMSSGRRAEEDRASPRSPSGGRVRGRLDLILFHHTRAHIDSAVRRLSVQVPRPFVRRLMALPGVRPAAADKVFPDTQTEQEVGNFYRH